MRRLIAAIGLELYALALAGVQMLGGVRSDEAKYLLDIPYPHPPFVRFILGLTSAIPGQELLWRVIFATLMVQAVWLVWKMGKHLRPAPRVAACASWLAAAPMLLQAGSVMLAVPTALFGLLFFSLQDDDFSQGGAAGIALLWLAALFSSYQSALYAPAVFRILRRSRTGSFAKLAYLAVPIALLGFYTFTNPLALATMVIHVGDKQPLSSRIFASCELLLMGGSFILTVIGVHGAWASRRADILLTVALLLLYVSLSPFSFYALLFLPPIIAGVVLWMKRHGRWSSAVVLCTLLGSGVIVRWMPLALTPGPSRSTMQAIHAAVGDGSVLIAGPFGHDWQYESALPIQRYRSELLPVARAVVCLQACADMGQAAGWKLLAGTPVQTWVRE